MNNTICALLLLACVTLFQVEAADEACSAQPSTTSKLKKSLFCAYDRSERPVKLRSSNVTVRVNMWLKHFFLHEEYNELELHVWMDWGWVDEFLTWDPSKHDGIDTLHIHHSEIWLPDVYQFTSSYMGYVTRAVEEGWCMLHSDGHVTCLTVSLYEAICSADLTKWPFDTHNCTTKLGSWWYSADKLDLVCENHDLEQGIYVENRDWKLLDFTAYKQIQVHEGSVYPSINFNFIIKRHAGGHAATVLIPALVLIVLTLVSFWLEPLGPNRFTVCCVNVLVHCLYLQYLGTILPSNGDSSPIIVLFYRDSLLLAGVALLVAAVVRCLTAASGAAPAWISHTLNRFLGSRPVQLLLQRDLSSTKEEAVTTEGSGTEEGPQLVASSSNGPAVKWSIIAVLLDRIFFLVFLLTYFVFILAFIP